MLARIEGKYLLSLVRVIHLEDRTQMEYMRRITYPYNEYLIQSNRAVGIRKSKSSQPSASKDR